MRREIALREHYDGTDTTDEMAEGRWEPEVDSDPMVTTSLRVPKSLLDWVREEAAAEQVRPSALIRRWIEDRRRAADAEDTEERRALADLTARVDRLESVTLRVAEATPAVDRDEPDRDSMTELLAALQRSVEAARAHEQTARRSSVRGKRGA
ncbi:MAG: hypothetical protein ACRDQ0_20455 [Pseudonocardia sp.]